MKQILTIAIVLVVALSKTTADTAAPKIDPNREAINQIVVPPLQTNGKTLIESLRIINIALEKKYPNSHHLPIVIERSPVTHIDLGSRVVISDLAEMSLSAAMDTLCDMCGGHWVVSENGYAIFKTWHFPEYRYECDDEVLIKPEGAASSGTKGKAATKKVEQPGTDKRGTQPADTSPSQ